jgi:parvulin-like peptidyl-prolyl isomerase
VGGNATGERQSAQPSDCIGGNGAILAVINRIFSQYSASGAAMKGSLSQSTARAHVLGAAACVLLALVGGCAGQDNRAVTVVDDHALVQQRVQRLFGEGVLAEDIVATVGDANITTGDVATWLTVFPTLSTQQAIDDLIDIHLGRQSSAGAPELQGMVEDAERQARVLHWLMRDVWTLPEATPSDEAVREVVDEPGNMVLFGLPELRRVSHILLRPEETATEADKQWARETLVGLREELVAIPSGVYAEDLLAVVDRLSASAAEHRMTVVVDRNFALPRVYSGTLRWQGIEQADPAFAAATFDPALRVGDLSPVVESQFGSHLILLEEIMPSTLPDRATQEALARQMLRAAAVTNHINTTLPVLAERTDMNIDPEVLDLLTQTVEQRIQMTQEIRTNALSGGD